MLNIREREATKSGVAAALRRATAKSLRRPGRPVFEIPTGGGRPLVPFQPLDRTRAARIHRGHGRPRKAGSARARDGRWMPPAPWRRSGGRRRARRPRTRGTSPPLPSRTALARSSLGSRPWGRRLVPRRRRRRELPTAASSIAARDRSGRWDRDIGRRNGVLLCSEVQT